MKLIEISTTAANTVWKARYRPSSIWLTNEEKVLASKAAPRLVPRMLARVRKIWKALVRNQTAARARPIERSLSADSCNVPSRSTSRNESASKIPTNENAAKRESVLLSVPSALTNGSTAVRFPDKRFIGRDKAFAHIARARW